MDKSYIIERITTSGMFITILGVVISPWLINPNFESFQISDWMISYQDGFIRRGLAGSILYYLHNNIIDISPIYTILLIDTVFFIAFLCIIINIFRKHKWSLATALFPIATCMAFLVDYRRDFMMLCFCYVTYMCFFHYLRKNKIMILVLSIILMTISILLYEPIFFVLIPILIIQYWNNIPNKKIIIKTLHTVLVFITPILCMLLSCVFKGTEKQSTYIWNSWIPIINPYTTDNSIEKGVGLLFLENSNKDVFIYHIGENFGFTPYRIVISIIILSLILSSVYYLCTFVPKIINKRIIIKYYDGIGKILIFQIIIQIPMFTILSNDFGRTIPMSIFTTFIIYHLSNTQKITIYVTPMIERLNNSIDNMIKRMNILKYYPMYFIIMLLFPLRIWSTPYIYDNIIYHLFIRLNKYILY